MKKTLIGLTAGAIAIAASVIPTNAAGPYALPYSDTTGSMWDYVDAGNGLTEQLVLAGGLANILNQCGNGKNLYTLFLPTEDVIAAFLEESDTTIADLAENPAVIGALLNDHLVKGAVDPTLLTSVPAGIKKLISVSGFVINIRNTDTVIYESEVWTDWYANGNQLIGAVATCNGWIYNMFGMFDPRDYTPVTGTGPAPTTAPAPAPTTASALPDTL